MPHARMLMGEWKKAKSSNIEVNKKHEDPGAKVRGQSAGSSTSNVG